METNQIFGDSYSLNFLNQRLRWRNSEIGQFGLALQKQNSQLCLVIIAETQKIPLYSGPNFNFRADLNCKGFISLLEVKVSILMVPNGLKDWDKKAARAHIFSHLKIPSFGMHESTIPYATLTLNRSYTEQRERAAESALKILNGIPPSQIPVIQGLGFERFIEPEQVKKLNFIMPQSFLKGAKAHQEKEGI